MEKPTYKWVHQILGQCITTLYAPKREISFGKSNTTLSSTTTVTQLEKTRERLLPFVSLNCRKMNHIFFDWPSVTVFRKHKADILSKLLGPHPPWRKLALLRLHSRYNSPAVFHVPTATSQDHYT
jgi:hypothetical protein